MPDRPDVPAAMPHYDRLDLAALAAACAVALVRWGLRPQCALGAAFLWLLWLASRSDVEQRKIADALNAQVALVGVAATALCALGMPFPCEGTGWTSHLAGALLVPAPLVLAVASGASFGGGDVKLLAASGLVLGAAPGLAGLFAGLVVQGVWALALRARGADGSTTFAAAPLLSCGLAAAALAAGQLLALVG